MEAKTLQRKTKEQVKQVRSGAGERAREAAIRAGRATRGARAQAAARTRPVGTTVVLMSSTYGCRSPAGAAMR
jgi:hypothetical protein